MMTHPRFCGEEAASVEEKAAAASRSHSEAERRRRQRINAHLATLRSLLPNAAKSDKASLLAEVVNRLRELRRRATEESREGPPAALLPAESDEVTAEADPGTALIRATVSCEDRPDLLSDLDSVLRSLKLSPVRAEIATLGGRTKGVFCFQGGEADCAAVRRALKAVLDRDCATALPGGKRPRLARPFGAAVAQY